jgi:hypothetical protein
MEISNGQHCTIVSSKRPTKILRPAVDNEEEITNKDELLEEEDEDDQDEYRPDWMILSEMGRMQS